MLHEKRIIPLSNNSNVIFNRTIIHKLLQNSLKNGLQEFNDWEKSRIRSLFMNKSPFYYFKFPNHPNENNPQMKIVKSNVIIS